MCMYTCVYVIIHFSIVCNSKRMEQSKCSLMQAGFIKLWYIHTMEFQAATKKKKRIQFRNIKKVPKMVMAITAQ